MKKLLTALFIMLSSIISAQVYCNTYTSYSQVDTLSGQFMSDIPWHTTVCIDYIHNEISIEDRSTKFIVRILYLNGDKDDIFYETKAISDNLEWKISMVSTKTHYLCVITKNNFTRIYKKER